MGTHDLSGISIQGVRRLFPGAVRQIYVDVSARGLLSIPVRDAALRFCEFRMYEGGTKEELRTPVEDARSRFSRLINADPDEVALVKNVSEGLNLFANSLPWQSGDNVVLCPDLEHPNNVFPWYSLEQRHGVAVRQVAPVEGRVPVPELLSAMDERTRLVTVPTVSFSPGFITDVSALASGARERGVLTLVDAAQSVGAVRTDVRALDVDGLAVATQKSLLGFYGTGFLYCRRSLADTLVPAHLARYGVDAGQGAHETAIGARTLRYQPGARRFDLGNYNYLGATAASAALGLIEHLGMPAIEEHGRNLAARLAQGMLDHGLPVAGGPPGPHLAHIVAVGRSGGGRHYTADDPAMNELYQHLTDNGVRLSIRRGVLRFSLAVYNNQDDVDRILDLAGDWSKMGS